MKIKKLIGMMLAGVLLCSALLSGCGSSTASIGDPNAEGAALNGKAISIGQMNFMARYEQALYDSYYGAYFGADMWSQDLYGNGSTMEQTTKDGLVDQIEVLYLLEEHQGDYKVSLSDEEMTAIRNAAQAFMAGNSSKAEKQMGATEEYVTETLRLYTIQYKMQQEMDKQVDTNVSDEEAAQRTFHYIQIDKNTITDAEGNPVDLTDAEKAALGQKAQDIDVAAKQDFDAAAADSGYEAQTYSYGKDDAGSMDQAVITAADALKEKQVSDLISTDTSYYILRLDSEFDKSATDAKKKSIVSQRKSDHYKEVTDAYKEAADWSLNEKEWAKVKFTDLFNVVSNKSEDTGTDNNTGN